MMTRRRTGGRAPEVQELPSRMTKKRELMQKVFRNLGYDPKENKAEDILAARIEKDAKCNGKTSLCFTLEHPGPKNVTVHAFDLKSANEEIRAVLEDAVIGFATMCKSKAAVVKNNKVVANEWGTVRVSNKPSPAIGIPYLKDAVKNATHILYGQRGTQRVAFAVIQVKGGFGYLDVVCSNQQGGSAILEAFEVLLSSLRCTHAVLMSLPVPKQIYWKRGYQTLDTTRVSSKTQIAAWIRKGRELPALYENENENYRSVCHDGVNGCWMFKRLLDTGVKARRNGKFAAWRVSRTVQNSFT